MKNVGTNLGKHLLFVWLRVCCSTYLKELSLPLFFVEDVHLNNV